MISFGQFRFPRYRPELDQSARSISLSPNRENSKSCRLVSFDFQDTDLNSIKAREAFRSNLIERTAKLSFGQFRFPRYRPVLDQSARSVSRSPHRENSKSCRLVSFDFRDT